MSFPTNICFICGNPSSRKICGQFYYSQKSEYRNWDVSIAKSFCQLFYMGESQNYSDVVTQFRKCSPCQTLLRDLDYNFRQLLSFQNKIGKLYNEILNLVDGNRKIQSRNISESQFSKWHPKVKGFYKLLTENSNLPIDFNEYHTPIVRKFQNLNQNVEPKNVRIEIELDSSDSESDNGCHSRSPDVDYVPEDDVDNLEDDIEITYQGKMTSSKEIPKNPSCLNKSACFDSIDDTQIHSKIPKTSIPPAIKNPGDPFICRPCSQIFNTVAEYTEHKRTCPTHFQCPFSECLMNKEGKSYDPVGGLAVHFNTTHYQKDRLRCLECLKSWKVEPIDSLASKLEYHLILHNTNEEMGQKFKCVVDECNEVFTNSVTLKDHVVRAHEDPDVVSICKICDKVFATKVSLHYHTKEYHNSRTPQLQCQDCEFKCNRPGDMRNHAKKHLSERAFLCHCCPKSYKTKRDLDRHYSVQHDPSAERKFKCSYANCEKAYFTSCTLKFHEESVHSHERSYICEFCSKTYKSKHGLDQHFRLVCKKDSRKSRPSITSDSQQQLPETKPNFTCNSCSKSFKSRRSWRLHQSKCGQGEPGQKL